MSLAALSTVCGCMSVAAPRSSPAPHFDGQRALSGGGSQDGVCAAAATVAASKAETARNSLMTILPRFFDTGIMRARRVGFNGEQPVAAPRAAALGRADVRSEPALVDDDGIAWVQLGDDGNGLTCRSAVDRAAELHGRSPGPWGEAAGDGDGGLRRHVRHVGILAGEIHLAEDEERPVELDLDR